MWLYVACTWIGVIIGVVAEYIICTKLSSYGDLTIVEFDEDDTCDMIVQFNTQKDLDQVMEGKAKNIYLNVVKKHVIRDDDAQ